MRKDTAEEDNEEIVVDVITADSATEEFSVPLADTVPPDEPVVDDVIEHGSCCFLTRAFR